MRKIQILVLAATLAFTFGAFAADQSQSFIPVSPTWIPFPTFDQGEANTTLTRLGLQLGARNTFMVQGPGDGRVIVWARFACGSCAFNHDFVYEWRTVATLDQASDLFATKIGFARGLVSLPDGSFLVYWNPSR